MALPTITLTNTTLADITLRQLAITVPASGSKVVSNFDYPYEVLNDRELQTQIDAGNITAQITGTDLGQGAMTSEQTKSAVQPITALDIKHSLHETTNPGVSDDQDSGYSIGSIWINTSTKSVFRCTDDSSGAAVWVGAGNTASNAGIILISGSTKTGYSTIAAALAAASSGDVVWVAPGSYSESVTVPAGVTLQAEAGCGDTTIAGAAATGTRVTLSNGAVLDGFVVTLPTNAVGAIVPATAASVTVKSVFLNGAGASGIGISSSGTGASTLEIIDVTYLSGTCDKVIEAASGDVFVQNLSVNAGTVSRVLEITGAGTFVRGELLSVRSDATVTRAVHLADASEFDGTNIYISGASTAFYVANSGPTVDVVSAVAHDCTLDIEVASGASTGTLSFVTCDFENDKFDYPAGYLETATVTLSFQDEKQGDEGFKVVGELSVGVPERGSETVLGEGDSYTRGMVVLNYTGATAATDGTFNADVSAAAASASGSTFGFPSGAVGDVIVWGSSLEDAADTLKHWGLKMSQTTAMSTNGAVIWEIWDGSTWAEIEVMAVESNEFYRYANQVFIRSNTSEQIRYGIDQDTTWSSKTLNGNDLFWSRVRITSAPTTSPVFQQSKLHTSRWEANADGTTEFFGLARYRTTLTVSGNAFGESGGVTSATYSVGSGGLPTGWAHQIKNSLLNGSGDAVTFQYELPSGIDTSQPIFVDVHYASSAETTTTNPTFILSFLPLEVSGVLVADPSGGTVPTARTVANTETLTAKAAQTDTDTSPATTPNKIHEIVFGPFDISDYYEGDIVLVRFELDNDGNPNTDIGVFNIAIDGVRWTPGDRI